MGDKAKKFMDEHKKEILIGVICFVIGAVLAGLVK